MALTCGEEKTIVQIMNKLCTNSVHWVQYKVEGQTRNTNIFSGQREQFFPPQISVCLYSTYICQKDNFVQSNKNMTFFHCSTIRSWLSYLLRFVVIGHKKKRPLLRIFIVLAVEFMSHCLLFKSWHFNQAESKAHCCYSYIGEKRIQVGWCWKLMILPIQNICSCNIRETKAS